PNPWPTYSCDPTVVTCTPTGGGQNNGPNQGANTPAPQVVPAGAAGAVVIGLPVTALWVRRRHRNRPRAKGPRSRLDSVCPHRPTPGARSLRRATREDGS